MLIYDKDALVGARIALAGGLDRSSRQKSPRPRWRASCPAAAPAELDLFRQRQRTRHVGATGHTTSFHFADEMIRGLNHLPRMDPGLRLLLAHVHDAGHERMQRAEVAEVAFAGKRMLELVVGIQTFRGEALIVAGGGMRRFVAIGPDDLGARCNGDLLRHEGELRDIDSRWWRIRREHRRRDEGCAEQCENGAGAKKTSGGGEKI